MSNVNAPATKEPGGAVKFLTLTPLAKHGMYDVGLLILRIAMLALIFHGVHKVKGYDNFLHGEQGGLDKQPVGEWAPEIIGFLVVVFQIVGPIFLLIGLFTRWAAFCVFMMFAFIILAVNIPGALERSGTIIANSGGLSFESSLFYFIPALALFFTGPGRISADYKLAGRV